LAFGVAWHCCSPGNAVSLVSHRSISGKGSSIVNDEAGAGKNGKRRDFEAEAQSNLCRQHPRIVNNNVCSGLLCHLVDISFTHVV